METISEGYLAEQRRLHENPNYGVASLVFGNIVAEIIRKNSIATISDYGAGKRNLKRSLDQAGVRGLEYFAYDPVFPEYGPPRAADLVCCIDVLEHIEIDRLAYVLDELKDITKKLAFFSIHTGPAIKTLSDGRNAHLIQQSASWWLPHLCERFEILALQQHQMMGIGFWVVLAPKK
jgi:hypothetical protein